MDLLQATTSSGKKLNVRSRLQTKPLPTAEIKLLNLMKIIVEAQWVIDDSVFNDMMKLSGYDDIIHEYFARQEAKD